VTIIAAALDGLDRPDRTRPDRRPAGRQRRRATTPPLFGRDDVDEPGTSTGTSTVRTARAENEER